MGVLQQLTFDLIVVLFVIVMDSITWFVTQCG